MPDKKKKIICAGHVCIDITPKIPGEKKEMISDVLQPGKLLNVGEADISLGGSVSNTGFGIDRLGGEALLMGKIGTDAFGDIVYESYDRKGLADGLIRQECESTSYSVVISIPGIDRIFLHHSGANDTFVSDDIRWGQVEDAAVFHFGYPPLMRSLYENKGEELVRIMKRARSLGAATSLDMAMVDPDSDAGKAPWDDILKSTLPYVDFFVPSVEELCFMLDRDRFNAWKKSANGRDVCEIIGVDDIRPLADTCMAYGCKVLMIKCGVPGMYLKTSAAEVLGDISPRVGLDAKAWADRELFEKSYVPDRILSGKGAGDTCISAFLTSILNGEKPEWVMHYAAATGASCVTELDTTSGLLTLPEIKAKIEKGWRKV